jgi:hypothetical protein
MLQVGQPRLRYLRGSVELQHVPRVGYVGLFPFLLTLIPPDDKERLGKVLDTIRDPGRLWSPYGLRSLSASDPFYRKENAPGRSAAHHVAI